MQTLNHASSSFSEVNESHYMVPTNDQSQSHFVQIPVCRLGSRNSKTLTSSFWIVCPSRNVLYSERIDNPMAAHVLYWTTLIHTTVGDLKDNDGRMWYVVHLLEKSFPYTGQSLILEMVHLRSIVNDDLTSRHISRGFSNNWILEC